MLLLWSVDFFYLQIKLTFQIILSGIVLECQTLRTDALSVLIWVQTVRKGNQETTKVAASKIKVKMRSNKNAGETAITLAY